MFNNGDIVKIVPAWLNSESEASLVFEVVNVNEVTKRCCIVALNTSATIPPVETVGFEMIQKI